MTEQLLLFDLRLIKAWPTVGEIRQARKALEAEADELSRRPVPVGGSDQEAGFREQFPHLYGRGEHGRL